MTKDYGIKVVATGKLITSDEPREYIINSEFGSVKIIQEPPNQAYQVVTVGDSATVTVTIPHKLGFIPLCMVFTELKSGTGRWYNGIPLEGFEDQTTTIYMSDAYADKDNLYLTYVNTGSSVDVKYYYYILGDAGS